MLVLNRFKKKKYILSIIYRLSKIFPLPLKIKFSIFSDLSWIFNRLAFETSNDIIKTEHISKIESINYFKKFINKNDNLLDLGCGAGEKTYLLSKYCNTILGIDYADNLIEDAKNNYYNIKNLNFIKMDLNQLRNNKNINYYDVIFLSHIVEHIDNTNTFFKFIKNFSDKIFIEVPDFDSNILNLFRKSENIGINYTDDDHVYEFDKKSLIKILYQNDFQIIDSENTHGVIRIIAKKNK